MTIEFADPGYNWAFVWWAIGLFVLGVFLFFLPFFLTEDEKKIAMWPVFGLILFITAPGIMLPLSGNDYDERVIIEKIGALKELGFSDVEISGDRFTAATEDGQYFRGVLVDLEPDEGYAYQVLELKGTEN